MDKKINPVFRILNGFRLGFCSSECEQYQETGKSRMCCCLLPQGAYRSALHSRICEPWVMQFADDDELVKLCLSEHSTDRLIERCASLLEENKVIHRRRNEALESHLKERTRRLEFEESLIRSAFLLCDRFGTCPLDAFDWEHPNTCDLECAKGNETNQQIETCWFLYLVEEGKETYKKKMG